MSNLNNIMVMVKHALEYLCEESFKYNNYNDYFYSFPVIIVFEQLKKNV